LIYSSFIGPLSLELTKTQKKNKIYRQRAWKTFERLYREHKCHRIGVSNFTVAHLEELFEYAIVSPTVNQVEFHPLIYSAQAKLLKYCQKRGIIVEGYSPFGTGSKLLLKHPKLLELGSLYNKSPSQIILRWLLHHNVHPVFESSSKDHILENTSVFDFSLSGNDIDQINNLQLSTSSDKGHRFCWDPSNVK